jgi:hypothetical protein
MVNPNDALSHIADTLCHSWHPPKSDLHQRFDYDTVNLEGGALAFGFLMAVGTLDESGVECDPTYLVVYDDLIPRYVAANQSETLPHLDAHVSIPRSL